jgi:cytoskeletal protein CcmA (bactofilin family)
MTMEHQERRDLNINGIVGGQGGIYRSVTINGQGKMHGDLDCVDFRCDGRTKVLGSMKAESAEIHGVAHIEESCDSKTLSIHGTCNIGGHLTGDDIEIHGFLKIKGNCDAESFHANGGFRVHGLLNAGTVEVKLLAPSEAKEIGGGVIRIERPAHPTPFNKIIQSILPQLDALKVETIEGDDIYLENTKAKVVRGTNVTIGQGCEIGLVEYKQNYLRDESAKVTESKQI